MRLQAALELARNSTTMTAEELRQQKARRERLENMLQEVYTFVLASVRVYWVHAPVLVPASFACTCSCVSRLELGVLVYARILYSWLRAPAQAARRNMSEEEIIKMLENALIDETDKEFVKLLRAQIAERKKLLQEHMDVYLAYRLQHGDLEEEEKRKRREQEEKDYALAAQLQAQGTQSISVSSVFAFFFFFFFAYTVTICFCVVFVLQSSWGLSLAPSEWRTIERCRESEGVCSCSALFGTGGTSGRDITRHLTIFTKISCEIDL